METGRIKGKEVRMKEILLWSNHFGSISKFRAKMCACYCTYNNSLVCATNFIIRKQPVIISTLLIAVWFYLHYSTLKTPIRTKTSTTDTNTYMASFSSNSWFEKVKCQLVENMCEALSPKPSLSNLLQYFYRSRFLVISGIVCKKTISTILPLTFERVAGLRWDFCHFYNLTRITLEKICSPLPQGF